MDLYRTLTGTNITAAEFVTITAWNDTEISGNAGIKISSMSYNPSTQVMLLGVGGPTGLPGVVSQALVQLPVAIRNKITNSAVTVQSSLVRTAESQSCSRPGSGRRLCE